MSQLRVSEHVRGSVSAHGGCIVLDLRAGRWYALNPTAERMWRELRRTGSLDDAVRSVAAAFPYVWEGQIRADGERLVRELADRRLVLIGDVEERPPNTEDERTDGGTSSVHAADLSARTVRSARAHLALLLSVLLLRLPFRWTVRLVSSARRRWCRRDAAMPDVAGILIALDKAAQRYPGRVACLENSLSAVVAAILYRQRLDWVIGVADDPVRFHSWVEVDGIAVLPSPDPEFSDYRRALVL